MYILRTSCTRSGKTSLHLVCSQINPRNMGFWLIERTSAGDVASRPMRSRPNVGLRLACRINFTRLSSDSPSRRNRGHVSSFGPRGSLTVSTGSFLPSPPGWLSAKTAAGGIPRRPNPAIDRRNAGSRDRQTRQGHSSLRNGPNGSVANATRADLVGYGGDPNTAGTVPRAAFRRRDHPRMRSVVLAILAQ